MKEDCPLCGKSLRGKFLVGEPYPSHHYVCPHCSGKIQRWDLLQGIKRHRITWLLYAVAVFLIWALHVRGMVALSLLGVALAVQSAIRWRQERNQPFWVPYVPPVANNSLKADGPDGPRL